MKFSFLNDEIKSLRYYGAGDLAGGVFVKNVIESLDDIKNNLDEINSEITDVEDMYRYLWLLSFEEMVKEIDLYKIDEETKSKIKGISSLIDYTPLRFITFINEKYKEALNKDDVKNDVMWYEYFSTIMKLIYQKYTNGIKNCVFDFIEEKFPLNILSDFNIYSDFYKKHKEKIPKLFVGLKDTKVLDDKIYLDFLLRYCLKNDEFLKEQAKFISERAFAHFKSIKLSPDNNDILQVQYQFEEYRELAISYKLVCANEYNTYKKVIDDLVNEYLINYGHKNDTGPIDYKPLIDYLKNDNNPFRFLVLTHSEKDDVIINNNDYILEVTNKSSFSEFLNRIGVPRSKKYPYFKQDSMQMFLTISSYPFVFIINDKELSNSFYNYLYTICNEAEQKFFKKSININDEVLGIFTTIANLLNFINKKEDNTVLFKAILNGCVLNECALFEKLLRNVALKEIEDVYYFDQDSNTIGSLFRNHHFKTLSKGLIYSLEFVLSREANDSLRKDERPGMDIRNIQMHNYNDKYEKTNIILCLQLFYLLLSILDDLFLKVDKVENAQETK